MTDKKEPLATSVKQALVKAQKSTENDEAKAVNVPPNPVLVKLREAVYGVDDPPADVTDLMREAADEIEKLHALRYPTDVLKLPAHVFLMNLLIEMMENAEQVAELRIKPFEGLTSSPLQSATISFTITITDIKDLPMEGTAFAEDQATSSETAPETEIDVTPRPETGTDG
jgi:hypothetical protein